MPLKESTVWKGLWLATGRHLFLVALAPHHTVQLCLGWRWTEAQKPPSLPHPHFPSSPLRFGSHILMGRKGCAGHAHHQEAALWCVLTSACAYMGSNQRNHNNRINDWEPGIVPRSSCGLENIFQKGNKPKELLFRFRCPFHWGLALSKHVVHLMAWIQSTFLCLEELWIPYPQKLGEKIFCVYSTHQRKEKWPVMCQVHTLNKCRTDCDLALRIFYFIHSFIYSFSKSLSITHCEFSVQRMKQKRQTSL